MFKKFISLLPLMALAAGVAFAQDDKGSLSAGFETNTTYYVDDAKTGAIAPESRFGSNNYLKMDYSQGNFAAGLQFEGYLPAINGFFPMMYGTDQFWRYDIYASFIDKGWDVRIGSLYEQFGSGMLLRTYEDRTLGVNNALQGIRVAYSPADYLSVRGLYGRVRDIKEYTSSVVTGADLSLSLSSLFKMNAIDLALEGSVVDEYDPSMMDGVKPHKTGYSGRLNFGVAGFQLRGEYMTRQIDPGFYGMSEISADQAEAIQLELGYSGKGYGALVTLRKLEYAGLKGLMQSQENAMYTSIRYVPALTQQHTYMLATMNPYTAQNDEIGGQADFYYNFKRNTVLGGVKGMKVHVNYSNFFGSLPDMMTGMMSERKLMYRDLTIDAERWFSKDFKAILFYSWQTLNPETMGKGLPGEMWKSHTIVADMTYKLTRKHSIRMELQHLFTKEDHKNWAAALLEFNVAPKWSVSVQDMWNYGDTKTHYINGNISYTYSKVRFAMNFGRFKEGYLCSGGVCRMTPAYTGANLSMIVTL